MRILLVLVLVWFAKQVPINLITSVITHSSPQTYKINCIDCIEPVSYESSYLPDFVSLDGNQLNIQESEETGQYHLSIRIVDGNGTEAHLLVVLVYLEAANKTEGNSGEQIVVSVQNPILSESFSTQLLASDAPLLEDEARIQQILIQQAQINQQIANLLILIRRYKNSKNEHEQQAASLAQQLQQLYPIKSGIIEQILLHENQLNKNNLAIKELLEFIKKVRRDIVVKQQQQISHEELITQLTEQLQDQLIIQSNLKATLVVRSEHLENITRLQNSSGGCDHEGMQEENLFLVTSQQRENQLRLLLNSTDDELIEQRKKIDQLRAQLAAEEQKQRQMLEDRSGVEQALFQVLTEKNSSLITLQTLKDQCTQTQNIQILNEQNIDKLKIIIQNLQQNLDNLDNQINVMINKIDESTKIINQIVYDIDFFNRQIDQSIVDLEFLHESSQEIEGNLTGLIQQRYTVSAHVDDLQERLASVLQLANITDEVLNEAKDKLAELMKDKKNIDQEVHQVMLNNLDIIKSLKGLGQHEFDLDWIVNNTDSITDFDISKVYQLKLDAKEEGSCEITTPYYGIGTIYEIQKGKISIEGNQNQVLDIQYHECSIIMSTEENYTPQPGDIICWKGYEKQGKWIILESIIFPQK